VLVRLATFAAALLALLSGCNAIGAQSPAPDRVVAIGDIHADMRVLRRAFELAGATNARDEWIGGTLAVVQLGDLIGRSDDERQVLDYIFDMHHKAARAGGAVQTDEHVVPGFRLRVRWLFD
jgi:hypothetical protein